jgi:hypothetical protein
MKPYTRCCACVAIILLAGAGVIPVWADDPPKPPIWKEPEVKSVQPGTQCAWGIEHKHKPTPLCGFNDVGAPKAGEFNCGLVAQGSKCVEQCTFTGKCAGD